MKKDEQPHGDGSQEAHRHDLRSRHAEDEEAFREEDAQPGEADEAVEA